MTPGLRHIKSLDGVRGIAVLSVLAHHTLGTGIAAGKWPLLDRFVIQIASYGYLGVDLFFVLSGFLITTLLLLARRRPRYFSTFYSKRAFRILPPFLLVIGALWAAHAISREYALISLLFVANFYFLLHVKADGPFWSLAIEEQFYLVWPVLVRKLNIRSVRKLLLVIVVAVPIIRLVMAYGGHSIGYYTFTRCDGLAWGALLATESRLHRFLERPKNGIQWWLRGGVYLWIAGAVLLVGAVVVAQSALGGRWGTAAMLTACPIFFASTISFLITHRHSLATKMFSTRIICFFGDISYTFYLVHAYVMGYYTRYFGDVEPGSSWQLYGRMLAVLAISTGICVVSYYYFERPVMRLRKYFFAV